MPTADGASDDAVCALPTGCGWFKEATAFTVCSAAQPVELDTAEITPIGKAAGLRLPQVPCAAAAECGTGG